MRVVITRLLPWLPHGLRRMLAQRLLGWEIDPTARLGRSLVQVGFLRMGPGARIGPRNVIRGLEELTMGREATIGGGNRITGYRDGTPAFVGDPPRRSALVMGDFASITTDHKVDCSDTVELEHHAVLAGFASVILTHSLDLRTNLFRVEPVRIGAHAIVMSGCTVFVGVSIAARSVVSAGAVVARSLTEEATLYHGNPATASRPLDPEATLLIRRSGHIGAGERER